MLLCHLKEDADNACECEPGFMCVPHMAVVHARELIARVNTAPGEGSSHGAI